MHGGTCKGTIGKLRLEVVYIEILKYVFEGENVVTICAA
jgi:hypothetical protein